MIVVCAVSVINAIVVLVFVALVVTSLPPRVRVTLVALKSTEASFPRYVTTSLAPSTSSPLGTLMSLLLISTVIIFLSRITTVSVPEIMPAVAETGVVAVTLPSVPTVNAITVSCFSNPSGAVVSVRV